MFVLVFLKQANTYTKLTKKASCIRDFAHCPSGSTVNME